MAEAGEMPPRGFATAEFAIDYLELTLPAANSGLREEEIPLDSKNDLRRACLST
jgi:hypothetical protein